MHNKNLENDFLKIVKFNERIIYKVISFYANSDQSSDDLYQEIILNLWKAFPSFRGDSKVSTWIYRIALNTCLTFFRRSKRTPIFSEYPVDIPQLPDNSDEIKELYKLINRLGEIEKALVLLYLDEKTYKEIADITGLTVTNVATKLSRIKDKLKQMSSD